MQTRDTDPSRRTFLGLAAAALLPSSASAQTPQPVSRPNDPLGVITRHDLSGPLAGYEVVLTRSGMRYFPGDSTPQHKHPGIVLAYVVEGRIRFAINSEPEQIVSAGGTFFEPFGAVHTTSGSAGPDETPRLLIFEVRPKVQA